MKNHKAINLPMLAAVSLITLCTAQPTQAQNQIVQNPGAVQLQEIWRVRGDMEQAYVGVGSGPVGDINKDGINDFAVLFGDAEEWRFYLGAPFTPSTLHSYSISNVSGSITQPVVGDFWGTGHKAIGLARDTCNSTNGQCFFRLALFRTETGTMPEEPASVIDTKIQFCPRSVFGSDLDGDGADDLIMSRACSFPEIWIYQGGGNFPSDTPTLKLYDTDKTSGGQTYYVQSGDIDGDGYPDLVTGGLYIDGYRLKFWYGSPTSPWSWGQPDRVVEVTQDIGVSIQLQITDVDGDGIPDFSGTVYQGDNAGIYLYLSRTGKDPHTRDYTLKDADIYYPTTTYRTGDRIKFLNDSTKTFEMFSAYGPSPSGTALLAAFSGSPRGPDSTYEAWHYDGLGNVFNDVHPVGDVNGDGWDDLLCANPSWYQFNIGIALILAGGPQIPRPDTATSGVRVVTGERVQGTVTLWPNPVHHRLTITWNGPLMRHVARMAVYDLAGRELVAREIDGTWGTAAWECGGVPPGAYLVTLVDSSGGILAAEQIVKQ